MRPLRHQQYRANQGYSLVELLLTMALLLLFAGFAVVSMRSMSQGSTLIEGTTRFETLLRYARAEAAYLGRRVRVDFVPETNLVASVVTNALPLSRVQLSWEPNPAAAPGQFEALQATRWGLDQVNETVAVETVRLTDAPCAEASTNTEADATPTSLSAVALVPAAPAGVTFNPDGSGDSAEITLAGRDSEDQGRVVVRVEGFTGVVSHRESLPKDAAENAGAAQESNAPAAENAGSPAQQ